MYKRENENKWWCRTKPSLTWKCQNKVKSHKAQFICPKWFKTMLYYTADGTMLIKHFVTMRDLLFKEEKYDAIQFIMMKKPTKSGIFFPSFIKLMNSKENSHTHTNKQIWQIVWFNVFIWVHGFFFLSKIIFSSVEYR